jgi:hypothetical protein
VIRPIAAGALGALFALAAAPASAGADDLRAAMAKFGALSSYEMTISARGRTTTIDIVNPHSRSMRSEGIEVIDIGPTTYMKMGGKWQKLRSSPGSSGTHVGIGESVRTMARKANDVKATDLGMKPVGGEVLHAYRMQSDGRTGTIYIGRDGLPHRFEDSGRHETLTISKFNAIAPIRPPI